MPMDALKRAEFAHIYRATSLHQLQVFFSFGSFGLCVSWHAWPSVMSKMFMSFLLAVCASVLRLVPMQRSAILFVTWAFMRSW